MKKLAVIENATGAVVNVVSCEDDWDTAPDVETVVKTRHPKTGEILLVETTVPNRARWAPAPGHSAREAAGAQVGFTWDGFKFVDLRPAEPAPLRRSRTVNKLAIVERLEQAGLTAAFVTARGGASLLLQERWLAANGIAVDDAVFRALFLSIGADPDVILA